MNSLAGHAAACATLIAQVQQLLSTCGPPPPSTCLRLERELEDMADQLERILWTLHQRGTHCV